MSKVHITLVGGQPAPVYHGIVATKPDKVVFIYSGNSRHVLERICDEINLPYEEIELDPINPLKIRECAQKLADTYKDDKITLNISSGLKSWSHLFGVVFDKMDNAEVVYMDQNNVLWNYKTMRSQGDFEFDMHALFRLYDNPLEKYKEYSDYTQADKEVIDVIEKIRKFSFPKFNALTVYLKPAQEDLIKRCEGKIVHPQDTNSFVEWKQNSNKDTEVSICLSDKKGKRFVKMVSPHAKDLIFHAGWFEFKVANILASWNRAKKIYLNCRFPFKQNVDKNETDIIVDTGTRVLFVECKTQINAITDIDKFRSVIKNYGGTGSKGLFVTQAQMTDIAKEKCKDNGILSFSLEDGLCGLPVDKALFSLLDYELFNINTK